MSHPRPLIMAALIAQIGALLPDLTISWGSPLTNNYGDYLFVGLADPTDPRPNSGGAKYSWPIHGGRVREESGAIPCSIESSNGDGDMEAAAMTVHELFDAVLGHVRENPTLGVPGVILLAVDSDNFLQAQTQEGAIALIDFQLNYTARI